MEIKLLEIKDLLARFQNILFSGEFKVESVIDVLHKILGVKVKKEDIKIKNNTLFLNIKPIYKSEILLNKDKIASELKKILGKKTPTDIR